MVFSGLAGPIRGRLDILQRGLFNPVVYRQIIDGDINGIERHLMDVTGGISPWLDSDELAMDILGYTNRTFNFFDWFKPHLEESGLGMDYNNILVSDGMGIACYGDIRYNGITIPVSYTIRIKKYANTVLKIEDNLKRKAYNLGHVTERIDDLSALRVIFGKTDRELFPRTGRPESFNPSSRVLDEIIQFMTGDKKRRYYEGPDGGHPSEENITLALDYSNRVNMITRAYERAHPTLTSMNNRYEPIVAGVIGAAKGIATRPFTQFIMEEHIMQIAMQRLLGKVLVEEFGGSRETGLPKNIIKFRDYGVDPNYLKDNGYTTLHIVWARPGFVNEYLEMQIRDFRHVYASHPDLFGHSQYLGERNSNHESDLARMIRFLIPDYSPLIASLVKKNFLAYNGTLYNGGPLIKVA